MLKNKAAANLGAGDALLALGLVDPAASRYYYALYQAAVYALGRLGWEPGRVRSGAVEWDHSMVQNNVYLVRRRRSDGYLYEAMRHLRRRADYDDRAVERGALEACVAAVREFVEEVAR